MIEIIQSYQEILIYGYQLHTINLNFDNESKIVVATHQQNVRHYDSMQTQYLQQETLIYVLQFQLF